MAKKVTVEAFIRGLLAIEALNPKYQISGVGLNGVCDCIGLGIGAFREAGYTWPYLRGTNYAARNTVTELKPFTGIGQLEPGMWVFTGKEPGSSSYNLPGNYQPGGKYHNGDLRDYSHVYYCLGDGWLIHCTKSGAIDGVTRINSLSAKNRYMAYSKHIDYASKGGEDNMNEKVYPTLRNGATGSFVGELQQRLVDLGYSVGTVGVDGKFGKGTEGAVKEFQRNSGLKVDGIAGKATWAALVAAIEAKPGPLPPMQNEDDYAGAAIFDKITQAQYEMIKAYAISIGVNPSNIEMSFG